MEAEEKLLPLVEKIKTSSEFNDSGTLKIPNYILELFPKEKLFEINQDLEFYDDSGSTISLIWI